LTRAATNTAPAAFFVPAAAARCCRLPCCRQPCGRLAPAALSGAVSFFWCGCWLLRPPPLAWTAHSWPTP